MLKEFLKALGFTVEGRFIDKGDLHIVLEESVPNFLYWNIYTVKHLANGTYYDWFTIMEAHIEWDDHSVKITTRCEACGHANVFRIFSEEGIVDQDGKVVDVGHRFCKSCWGIYAKINGWRT